MKRSVKSKRFSQAQASKKRALWLLAAVAVLVVAVIGAVWFLRECKTEYNGEEVRIYVPSGITEEALADTLRSNLGESFGKRVFRLWGWRDGRTSVAEGSYVVSPGMSVAQVSNKLLKGAQDPVKVTFNNVRTMKQLAERVSRRLDFSAEDFLAACDSVLGDMGFSKASRPAAFVPDTYDFYWSADPGYVVRRLVDVRNKFWTKERLAQAEAMHLTPEQVATVASIIEEETAKADERSTIARLYLNRLKKGMKLQADPTVKFAYGDFSLRRITNKHLQTQSPYNTYLHEGLPPGPIRIVERRSLDDVLYAPEHDYLYMCAKEDFSGYHNFARTGAEHLANAQRYHNALNRRGIK